MKSLLMAACFVSCSISVTALAHAQCGAFTPDFPSGNAPVGGHLGGTVSSLAMWDDGNGEGEAVYVVGDVCCAAGLALSGFGRWSSNSGWSSMGFTSASAGRPYVVRVLQLPWDARPMLYVAGSFASVASVPALQVARFDGTSWSQLGNGLPPGGRAFNALAAFDDGTGVKLYAGGSDWNLPLVWSFDGANWSQLGPLAFNGGGRVDALAIYDDGAGERLYASGYLPEFGNVARYVGPHWEPLVGFGPGDSVADVNSLVVFDDGTGPALYANGEHWAAGITSRYVEQWRGSGWTRVSPLISAEIFGLAVLDTGDELALYVTGAFTRVGGTTAQHIARLVGGAWQPLGTGIDQDPNQWTVVGPLCAGIDRSRGERVIFAGGRFMSAGGAPAVNLARFAFCRSQVFGAGDGLDPAVTPCPCGNFGAPGHGCENSRALGGALLEVRGAPSVSNDTVELAVTSTTNGLTLFLQAETPRNGGAGIVFDDGVSVLGTPLIRLGTRTPAGNQVAYGAGHAGDVPVSIRGHVPSAGATRYYQARYRDVPSFCTPATANWTNGVVVQWVP